MFGEYIGAEEALKWGLVERVVEAEKLDEAVEEWVGCLEKSGMRAVRSQKVLMRKWEGMGLDAAIEAGIESFGQAFEADEGGESEPRRMMGAFLKKQQERKGSSKL